MSIPDIKGIAKKVLNDVEFFDFSHVLGKGEIEAAKEHILKAVDRDVRFGRMSSLSGMEIYNQLDLSPKRASQFPQQELLRCPKL